MRFASRFARLAGRGLRGLARRLPARLRYRPRRRMIKKTQNKVHSFVRWCDKDTQYPGETGPSQILADSTEQNLAYSFKLDNVVNPSDFTNLYDMYRINKVTLYLERLWESTSSSNTIQIPNNKKIRVVHDYNDNNVLAKEDDYLEYSNCRSYNSIGRGAIKITLYPKVNNIVENAGGSPNAFTSMNSNKVWLNIVDDDVPHFGLKIFIPANVQTEDVPIFQVRAKFHLSLKNSK